MTRRTMLHHRHRITKLIPVFAPDGTVAEYETQVQAVLPGNQRGRITFPEIAGYRWGGWYYDTAQSAEASFDDVQADATVYAWYMDGRCMQPAVFTTSANVIAIGGLPPLNTEGVLTLNGMGFYVTLHGTTKKCACTAYYNSVSVVHGGVKHTAESLFGAKDGKLFYYGMGSEWRNSLVAGDVAQFTVFYITENNTEHLGATKYYQYDGTQLVEQGA